MTTIHTVAHIIFIPLAVACISWTVTQEEIFRELREWCINTSKGCKKLLSRKFFYLLTCEYCFSHYVVLFFLLITRFHLLYSDWRGYIIAGFACIFIANVYMSSFALLRQKLKKAKAEANLKHGEFDRQRNIA